MAKGDELNEQQELFCHEFIKDLNATQAYIRAGYAPKTARVCASQLLATPNVQRLVDALIKERAERVKIDAGIVIEELLRIARTDLSAAYDSEGNLLPVKDMPEDVRRAIAGVEVDEIWNGFGKDRTQIGVTRKVKFWDKPKALELLGKHLKMFVDRVEHSGKIGLAELLGGGDDGDAKE